MCKLLFNTALFIRENSVEKKLSPIEKVVLISLSMRIGNNNNTWVTQSTLAQDCNISVRYIKSVIHNLKAKNLISTQLIATNKGKQNTYQLSEIILNYPTYRSPTIEETRGSADPLPQEGWGSVDPQGWGSTDHHPQDLSTGLAPVALGVPPIVASPKVTIESNNKIKDIKHVAFRFEEFWSTYPRKENKIKAKAIWARKKLDAQADTLIADVRDRGQRHSSWLQGYIPHATTYLNGERWNDDITEEKNDGRNKINLNNRATKLKEYWGDPTGVSNSYLGADALQALCG